MEDEFDVDDFLEHYGKKGMKWGIINEEKPIGRAPAKKKEEPKSDAALKKKYQKVLRDEKVKPLTKEQTKAKIIETEKKSSAKFETDGTPPKGPKK